MSDALIAEMRPNQKTSLTRFAMAAQSFLLRRNWMGSMGDFVMVLRHRGRRSGKQYETPVSYLRQGSDLLAISSGKNASNWFLNTVAAGEAELNIKGQTVHVKAVQIVSPEEINRVFDAFHKEYQGFERAFRVKRQAPREVLNVSRDRMVYLRLTPV